MVTANRFSLRNGVSQWFLWCMECEADTGFFLSLFLTATSNICGSVIQTFFSLTARFPPPAPPLSVASFYWAIFSIPGALEEPPLNSPQ